MVFRVDREPGPAKGVVADSGFDPGRPRPSLDRQTFFVITPTGGTAFSSTVRLHESECVFFDAHPKNGE